MRYILFLLTFVIFSCSNVDKTGSKFSDREIVERILKESDQNFDSIAIINIRQGIFAFDSLNIDTALISYSGFVVDRIPHFESITDFDNLFYFKEAPGLFEVTEKNCFQEFSSFKLIGLDSLTYRLKVDTINSKLIGSFDWQKLEKVAIKTLYSFSQPSVNDSLKCGYIGLQSYSRDDFSVKVYNFEFKDKLRIHLLWSDDFKPINYRFKFYNKELSKIDINSMVVK